MKSKGQFQDGLMFTIGLFIIAVIFLSFGYVFPRIATAFNQTGVFNSTQEQTAINNLASMGSSGINQGFIIFFGGLILVQFASAFFVRYHPVFMIIFLFMIFVNGFLAIYLGNTFNTLIENPSFAQTITEQTAMVYVYQHILPIIIAIDILTLIILFAKVGEAPV